MRIPFEALTQFLTGRPPDAKRTEPVAASADLGEAPQFSLRHWTPGEEHGNRDGHSPERGPGEAPTPSSPSAQPPRPKGSPTRLRGAAQGRAPPTEHSGAARHAPVSLPTRNRPPDGDQPQSLNPTPTTLITNRKGATQAPFPILKPGNGMFRSRWSALPLLRAPRSARSQPPTHRPPGAIAGPGRRPPERR